VGLLLLAALSDAHVFPDPFGSGSVRKFERDADDYSYKLTGSTQALCSALKRLAKDNLANLTPTLLFLVYYSHPPLTERIRHLQAWKPSK